MHIFDNDRPVAHYNMGDSLPYARRPVDYPNFVVPLEVQRDSTMTVYLRVQSTSSLQVPLTLYRDLSLAEAGYDKGMVQALFYGAMLMMVIYNLLVFLSLRDRSYLYYVLFVISILTLLAGIEGLTFKYLWPNATWLKSSMLVVAFSSTLMFAGLFFQSFLALPKTRPRLSKFASGFSLICLACIVGAFVLPYRLMMMVVIVVALCGIPIGFFAGILRWRDGYEPAKYLNIAWTCMLVTGALHPFISLGVLPRNGFTENILQIGVGLQALLLSFALAYRMTQERDMRERAQQQAVAAQQNLLLQQIRASEDLDHMVRQRTEELEQANSKLEKMGATDALTGLTNRRAFESAFETEYKRAYRGKSPLAILMIDLDHFKSINDRYGHAFGDLCLKKAASLIQTSICRPPDVTARYGGEEFIVMLPDTYISGAIQVAETILAALSATEIRDEALTVKITASIGVASRVPASELEQQQLTKEADQNLYAAKAKGRNRVEWRSLDLADGEQPTQ